MIAQSLIALAALAGSVSAAPIEARKNAPAGWWTEGLEPYMTYHTRYLALQCYDHKSANDQFWQDCCSPLLKDQSLSSRPDYCTPSTEAVASVSSSLAAKYASTSTPTAPAAAASASTTGAAAAPTTSSTTQAPTTTSSTQEAPAATTSPASNNNGGGGQFTGGFATYFYQGGNPGACGNYNSDSTPIVAIDQDKWYQSGSGSFGQPSSLCGKWLTITNTNNGKSVTAQVADVCPTCTNGNSLDLSVGAFTAIASESDGMVPISWSWN